MRDFTVLVLPGAFASSVAVTLDILQAAATLAPRARLPRPTWRVLSLDGGAVALSNGLQVETVMLPIRTRSDASTWIIPGLGMDRASTLHARLARDDAVRAIAAVRRHVARGGAVAAACSAVFLLQAAGVLHERRATTSWWLAPELRRIEPRCSVDADRMVCVDGPVSTAGAALAQSDLMLHLLRTRFGSALAEIVGRVLLIDGRQAQAPFVVPSMLSNGNELVRRLTERIESSLPRPPSVAAIDETFTITPPLPPFFVDMRRAASRQHSIRPMTFTANRSEITVASNSSTRPRLPLLPALLTRWVIGPSAFSVSSNRRTMSASRAMSPGRAMALPPLASMSATTCFACASRVR